MNPDSGHASANVVVVDDEPRTCQTIAAYLRGLPCEVTAFSDPAECLGHLQRSPADIVIADIRMPRLDGIMVLRQVKEWRPDTDVIIVTGAAEKSEAIQALKLGAFDFFEKPVERIELVETVRKALRYRQAVHERDQFAAQVSFLSQRELERWGTTAFVGDSPEMARVRKQIEQVRRAANTSVLVTGESGTGKELVARAIHFEGPRRGGPFVPVNCPAVPAALAESVLFGHVKGAFTGATSAQKGYFCHAAGGTLFLDEIGDMPGEMQTKLLRVLEDGVVTPVGGAGGERVDVRVIAATNADLGGKIEAGQFRADLYYRLAGFVIHVPALRDRRGDIVPLARHFARLLSREMGMTEPRVEAGALAVLQGHTYPGNVRELRNVMERALIQSGGEAIETEHIHFLSHGGPVGVAEAWPASTSGSWEGFPLNLAAAEEVLIRRALAEVDGNVSAAARLLGINRTKLYRRMAALAD
jgi:DNA-binding NtrC family response regulator